MILRKGLTVALGLAFLVYGVLCLATSSMVKDFERFGMPRMRVPTGWLEVLGGVGLLVGLRWMPALRLSAGGLSLMMLIAFGVRLKMHDSLAASLPSFVLMALNLFLFVDSFRAS